MSVNANSVVLIRVKVNCVGETKKDDFLTNKVRSDMKATDGWTVVRKKLFDLKPITKHRDRMRKLLRDRCVPWSSTLTDVHGNKKEDPRWAAPASEAGKIMEELSAMKEDFFDSLNAFDYDAEVERAEKALGNAFNKNDFPTEKEFKERWSWDVEVTPLMDLESAESDFRLKLPQKHADEQVERYKKDMDTRVVNGVRDVMRRAVDNLMGDDGSKGLIPRLREYDPDPNDKRKGNTFRDKSLYDTLDEYREWVDNMNTFLENEQLEELGRRLGDFCDNVRPEDPKLVREDEQVRQEVIEGLMGVLDGAKPEKKKSNGKSGFDQLI